MGVNDLTDRSEEELRSMRGYNKFLRAPGASRGDNSASSLIELGVTESICSSLQASCINTGCCGGLVCTRAGVCEQVGKYEDAVDWTDRIPLASHVPHQGGCGSCWAVAATSSIQLQATLNEGFGQTLSPDSMIKCTPNPHECGGSGGCKGATAQLAFAWVKAQAEKSGGLQTLEDDPYTGTSESCDYDPFPKTDSFLQARKDKPLVGIKGWAQLPANKADPVLRALVQAGPMVVSIVGSGLSGYAEGIISECKSWNVDHAVLLMGFGGSQEQNDMHWKIRNSWGEGWGEKGFFKVKRYGPHEKEPCGVDTDPSVGIACKNEDGKYPERQNVCGVCGVLFDSSYPLGAYRSNA